MAWIWLSLNLFCWFWESCSSPDRCWLVHLLFLQELVVILTLRSVIIESTSRPSRFVWGDWLLHRTSVFWVSGICWLQGWYVSLSFCAFSNRYTTFSKVNRKSLFHGVKFRRIKRAFADELCVVFHRFGLVASPNFHLNSRLFQIQICTFHIFLSFDNCWEINSRVSWMSLWSKLLLCSAVFAKLHPTSLPKMIIRLLTFWVWILSIKDFRCALLLANECSRFLDLFLFCLDQLELLQLHMFVNSLLRFLFLAFIWFWLVEPLVLDCSLLWVNDLLERDFWFSFRPRIFSQSLRFVI